MSRIEPEVIEYAKSKGKKNILVYRDIPFGSCRCSGGHFLFTTKVRLSEKEPNEYFSLLEKIDGVISVWVEKALMPKIEGGGYVKISLTGSFLKKLSIEFGSELIGRH